MDVYLFLLVALVAALIVSLRHAMAESRRRKRAWAAYYDNPNRAAYARRQRGRPIR